MKPILLQIVPSLPPAVGGVGDYAVLLAQALRARHGVESRFLVGDPAWRPVDGEAEFPARAIVARTEAALLAMLSSEVPAVVLLHYVPYGYAPRGCPFWLVAALRRWQARPRLLTVFHEFSADNEPVWKTAFWLSPLQRRLGRQLGRLSSVRRTTTTQVAHQLRAMLPPEDCAVQVAPVFSNLGEGNPPLPLGQRQRRMVVFGTRTWREEIYQRHLPALLAACEHLGVKSILDVGSPLDSPPTCLPLPFSAHGLLRNEDAPAIFGQSLAGFFTYPAPWLGKSGIFAAYCAHGLVPVTISGNDQPNLDGLQAGTHYFPGGGSSNLAEVARAAHSWYRQHRLSVHAQDIHQAIADFSPS